MAKKAQAEQEVQEEVQEKPVKLLSLDEAIAARIKERKQEEAQAKKNATKDKSSRTQRVNDVAALLSAKIAKQTQTATRAGVEIPAADWVIEENMREGDQHYYDVRLNFEAKPVAKGEEALPIQPGVWVKNITRSSLLSENFLYRWTARSPNGSIQKFNKFLDAVTFAKTGE